MVAFRFKSCSLSQLITLLCSIYKNVFPCLIAHVVWVARSMDIDKFNVNKKSVQVLTWKCLHLHNYIIHQE